MRQVTAYTMALLLVVVSGAIPLRAAEVSGVEASAYQKATAEKDAATRASLLESYLQQYPEGAYKLQANYFLTLAYRELNQPEKVSQYGEETLKLDPENLDVLLLLATAYSAKTSDFEKSLAYSDRALQAIAKKASSQPPANVSAEQWHAELEKLKKGATYTKSLVQGKMALGQKDFAAAADPLRGAYAIQKTPMVAFWLGIVYSKTGKVDDAITVLCEAVAMNGPSKDQAQKELERLFLEKNHSLDGLQQRIDEAKARVGSTS